MNKEITPKELMEQLKNSKKKVTNEELERFYNVCINKLQKYLVTGQVDACRKIKFLADNVAREQKLLEHGIDTYVYFNDISSYINEVKDKQISIIELSRYEREIPDEIVDTIAVCKEHNLFDEYIVVFTDYHKEMSKKTKKEDREKDPIIFGMFYNNKTETACPRFYFLGDWVDDLCDLTLEKMLSQIGEDKKYTVDRPMQSMEELNEKLSALEKAKDTNNGSFYLGDARLTVPSEEFNAVERKKSGFFKKVKTAIFGKKGE